MASIKTNEVAGILEMSISFVSHKCLLRRICLSPSVIFFWARSPASSSAVARFVSKRCHSQLASIGLLSINPFNVVELGEHDTNLCATTARTSNEYGLIATSNCILQERPVLQAEDIASICGCCVVAPGYSGAQGLRG